LKPDYLFFVKGQLKIVAYGIANAMKQTIGIGVIPADIQRYRIPEKFLNKTREGSSIFDHK
jgi:hypothetical protein